jgi:putative aminopeptidase FrvX
MECIIIMELLRRLCSIQAPSGDESLMYEFLLEYIEDQKANWKFRTTVTHGPEFQHCIILEFGVPRTAVFAHIDNIGFTARYKNELVKIGGPRTASGYKLVGEDSIGKIECTLEMDKENNLHANFNREIQTGTNLSFQPNFREDSNFIQCCYLDNRLGVYNALKLAEELQHGVIVFSCWEEHGGGSIPYITKYLWEKFKIKQTLISDITWITDGVTHGQGVVVSLRDSGLPRRVFTNKIRNILNENNFKYQIEVESSGGSDGNEIQKQPYPIDWCFIGAAEEFVHSPDEKVHKFDIQSMLDAYKLLMEKL